MHPFIVESLARDHHRQLLAAAQRRRLVRQARERRPAFARPAADRDMASQAGSRGPRAHPAPTALTPSTAP